MFHNVNEILVSDVLEEAWRNEDCCKCEKCKRDIMALALNQLKPSYVASEAGDVISRTKYLDSQYKTDLIAAVSVALRTVQEKPNHPN